MRKAGRPDLVELNTSMSLTLRCEKRVGKLPKRVNVVIPPFAHPPCPFPEYVTHGTLGAVSTRSVEIKHCIFGPHCSEETDLTGPLLIKCEISE